MQSEKQEKRDFDAAMRAINGRLSRADLTDPETLQDLIELVSSIVHFCDRVGSTLHRAKVDAEDKRLKQ